MTVKVSRFRVLSDPRHMATHTIGKRVKIVGLQLVQYLVALKALLGTRRNRLRASGRQAYLVHVMADVQVTPSVK